MKFKFLLLIFSLLVSTAGFFQATSASDEPVILNVPFKAQVPPGDWDKTKNCGQASALMVFCYYNGTTPTVQGIKDIDDWLYQKYGDPVNNYNGSETNTTKLEALAREYGGFAGSYKASRWDIERLKQEIDAGHPVIVAVIAGYLSNRGYSWAGGHFLVVKGYDDANIICNDPGTSGGENKYYTHNEFSAAMAAQKGAVVVVVPAIPILCAGTSNPGLVYRYLGDTNWQPIATPEQLGNAWSVLSLAEYNGHLYAGTMSTSNPTGGVGRVYRYDGRTSWTLVGDNLDNQVSSLAVYKGNLYAGTAWNGMKLYRYEGDTSWKQVIDPVIWYGTRALHASHGYLLMGDIEWDYIGRWDGSIFTPCQTEKIGSCIYDFEDYGEYVYASGYEGVMWQSPDGINWRIVLDYDYYKGNMWELETFQDFLYMAYANGELRASNVPDRGTLIYKAPDGIISMKTDGVNLYFGTGGEAGARYGSKTEGIANVYRYDGNEVTLISDEDKFGGGVQVLYFLTPKVPAVTTNDATVITTTGAKLNGDLTSLGTATTVRVSFQWGVTSGVYPNETTPKLMNTTGAFSFELSGLNQGSIYYFRAKAVGDGTTYGGEKGFITPLAKPECFIATAAYGSALQPFVKILQEFKDKYLMSHKFGRVMVDIYYRYSPSIAEIIAKNKILKAVVRACLLPLVAFSYSILHLGPAFTALLLVSIFMVSIFLFLFLLKRVVKSGEKKE